MDKKFIEKVDAEMNDSAAATALLHLAAYLSKYYGKKTIILLEEYDTPLQEAYVNGYWDEMAGFMRTLLHSTLNRSLLSV